MSNHSISDLPPAQQAAWLDGYQHGYLYGIQAGRQQLADEDAAAWARMREAIHAATSRPDYATLTEHRGQHGRAQQQRSLLAERGIA